MNTEWVHLKADEKQVKEIADTLGLNRITACLMVNRGITTTDEARKFLSPSLDRLPDPFLFKDMDRAVVRIHRAIKEKEKILVFGDFDADGVTSTTLVVDFLTRSNAEVSWYIPHRQKEGYSLKPDHIKMSAAQGIDLIITVDCGSDSFQAIEDAALEDIDIIVTDHHEVPAPLPPAFALINPKRKDCPSGLSHLAGVGVAFYLIIALRKHLRDNEFYDNTVEPNLKEYCDLVAMGTIADMVPLKHENRILTAAGIKVLREGRRPGFKAIAQISRISEENMDSEDISFRMAPRINAAGRISHARICVDLLTSRDSSRAEQTAAILDKLNRQRQDTEQGIIQDIEKILDSLPELIERSSLVLWHDNWNSGVLGIAASKMANKFRKPTILISTDGDLPTGSCRSVNKINIHEALSRCSHLLERFGGHAMAAGIAVKRENLSIFAQSFDETIQAAAGPESFNKEISIDHLLDFGKINQDFIKEMDRLKPFGMGNPEPLFSCSNVKVVSSTIIGTRHLKMVLESDRGQPPGRMEALQFNIDPNLPMPTFFAELAFRVRTNRYGSTPHPQIIIEATHFLT
ncbi:MAG: single-stranded-DNA-specific exonuclease RecJ [Desulfobacteraceae bacterium 4572_89]|nr:MAG: single-stranded-DNA-specific exonuclease RecJ [Desulfobacteraceae bacterium 4572_89]